MHDWFIPAPSKPEFRESIGSEHVFFSYFDGTPVRPYESLPAIAAAGRKYEVRELCVWDRLSLRIYGTAYSPDEDILKYNLEDRQILSEAIRKAVAGGTDVSALVNFRVINPSLDVFRQERLESEIQSALSGTAKTCLFGSALTPGDFFSRHMGPYCNVLSPFSDKYRQRLLEQIQIYLDMGYTSLFYDQPFEDYPDYSRKKSGGVPEMTYAATLDLIRDVRKKLREKNPDAVIMGEQCDVFGSEIIDQWMTWIWSDQDIASAIRVHYSLPQTVINCVVDRKPGLAHITGGGLVSNIPRILPKSCKAIIHKDSWRIPPIFSLLQKKGNISDEEMFQVFNMGIGMVAVAPENEIEGLKAELTKLGETPYPLGEIGEGNREVEVI